jgi:hypothetical protein
MCIIKHHTIKTYGIYSQPWHNMRFDGHVHALTTLSLEKALGAHQTGFLMGPRASLYAKN